MLKRLVLTLALVLFAAPSAFAAGRTIIVAHDATWPPMEYLSPEKKLVGYSVDYMDAVAKEAGFTAQHKNIAWDGIFAELASKKCDVIASSVTITQDRKKTMDFSTPYYEVRQAVVVAKAGTIKADADLQGKTLGAQISTTGYFAAQKIKDAKPKSYDEIGLAIEDLFKGRLDAVICDDPVAADFALKKANYAEKLHIAFILKSTEPEHYGFAVRKGDKDTLDLLNKGIAAVKSKGIEAQLTKKWMGK